MNTENSNRLTTLRDLARPFRLVLVTLFLPILIIMENACGPQQDSLAIRIGILKHESSLPFYVAEELGLFAKQKIGAQLIELPPGDHMPALLSNRVDVISPTTFPTLFGIMQQHPDSLYVLFPGAEVLGGQVVYGLIVRLDFIGSDITSLQKKVVMAINPFTQVNIQTIFSSAGIHQDSWPEVRVASRDVALQAVSEGTASAAIMDQPALAVALQSGSYRLLESNPRARHINNPYWSGAGAIKRTTWTERNASLLKLLSAIDSAITFIEREPDSAHSILAKRLGLDPQIAGQMGGYYFPKSHDSVPVDGIERTVQALIAAKLLTGPVHLDDMFPPGLYR